jgi:phosphonate transport system substrate-binding protein
MASLRVHSFLGLLALPHYAAVGALVTRACGLRADPVDEPGLRQLDEVLAAPGPALLFLCGLPYVRARGRGAPVEAIAGAIPCGDDTPRYYSDMVLRRGLEAGSAESLVGRRIGLNGRDSLSGYVLPESALVRREPPVPLYEHAVETGGHHQSLALLVAGEIDAAAIDSTVLALEARADPAIAALVVAERFGPAPIPPVVLVGGDPVLAGELRDALLELDRSDEGRAALELGLIDRYVAVSDSDYDPVRAMDAAVR